MNSDLRALVADYARRLHARGWVANHDGNVSARLGPGSRDGAASFDAARFVCTPTAISKAEVRAEGLVIVDDKGEKVGGRGKPFSELGLHLTVYRSRPDVNAVVHAHPPTATGFAVAGVPLAEPILAEAVVSLGPGVPTVPFAAPGPAACAALAPFTLDHDAVLLAGNGALAWGPDVETAYLRLELVEHLARIALVARQLGGARPLPADALPGLLAARAKAGLGRKPQPIGDSPQVPSTPAHMSASPSARKTVVACAPPPPGSDVEVYDPKRARAASLPAPGELAAIIRQEIAAALKK
jgi:L-fuculose-phosphate aldolase